MGKEDALRGWVSWLVEPLYGKRLPRPVQSTHHLEAEALAKTHRLSLAAFGDKLYHLKWPVTYVLETLRKRS